MYRARRTTGGEQRATAGTCYGAASSFAIVSSEDVVHGKPDPEVFLTAARRLDASPGRSVVVEDAAAGVEAARRAGMRSVGVSTNAALAADVPVASLADLPNDTFDRLIAESSD